MATRESPWVVHPLTMWEDPADDERAIQWTRDVCADVKPYATGATYLNFVGDEGEDRIVSGYGRSNYDRLAAVKTEFDPATSSTCTTRSAPWLRPRSTCTGAWLL